MYIIAIIYFDTEIKNDKSAKKIKLDVFKNNGWIQLKADKGIPASKICVNPTFQIVPEKTDIKTIYGEFKNWIADHRIIWY